MDRDKLKRATDKMNVLYSDIDRLLAANQNFLLGNWLESAKRWGKTEEERKHYEWNVKTIITLWSFDYWIDDYSARTWSGMLSDYYANVGICIMRNLSVCLWTTRIGMQKHSTKKWWNLPRLGGEKATSFPTKVSGENAINLSKELLQKYENDF